MAERKKETRKPKAIAKRVGVRKKFTFTGLDKKEYILTEQQKLFVEFYMDPFLNGAQAVIEAGYDCTNSRGDINMRLAAAIASENLVKPNICQYIATLIDESGLNDNVVDKHLLFNISQFSDLRAKNTAIEIYNKLKRRYGNTPDDPSIAAPQTEREAELTAVLLKKYNDLKHKQSDSSLAGSTDS